MHRQEKSARLQISLFSSSSRALKLVMRRKSEFELRMNRARTRRENEPKGKAYCTVYLCFIDCQQLRTFEFFRFLMYLNLSLASLFAFSSLLWALEIAFIIPFFLCIKKEVELLEYCSGNMS
jgi:hypothetical protein